MHNLKQAEKDKIYAVYLAIFNLPFNTKRKNTLLTALVGGSEWSWRVTGITEAALEMMAQNRYKYGKGKICRAHLINRIDTARNIFEISEPLPEDQFFKKVWESDKTVIAIKSENKMTGKFPKFLPIDYERGLFRCKSVGFEYKKQEADYLRKLYDDYKAGRIPN